MALRSKFLSVFGLLVALTVFSLAAMAQDTTTPAAPGTPPAGAKGQHRGFGGPEGRRGPGGPEGMMMGELRDINLTDAQKQQIHTIMENNKPDQAQAEQMRTLMDAKRMAKRKQVHDQIMAVLTPDQIQQIEQHKKEMKEHWEQKQQQAPPAPTKPSN